MSSIDPQTIPVEMASSLDWRDVCAISDIPPDTGVAALIDGRQIAVIRRTTGGERIHALDQYDPSSRAMVLSRGLVGDRGGVPIITSPITKLAFDLASGICLDRPDLSVQVHGVRLREGRIELRPEKLLHVQ